MLEDELCSCDQFYDQLSLYDQLSIATYCYKQPQSDPPMHFAIQIEVPLGYVICFPV